mmetsp:Transcript_7830/g.28614  ORF Transcript_7830/g.28614 Transcript_7830/m.28614 type:complete len:200 (+) Transcript_7830:298-897(+)
MPLASKSFFRSIGALLVRFKPPVVFIPFSRVALSAFAGVTRLQRLSISRAANLLRISSCKTILEARSCSRTNLSAFNFSAFLVSFGSSLFSSRSNDRSATWIAASTSKACISKSFFVLARVVVRLAIACSTCVSARFESALTRSMSAKARRRRLRQRPRSFCVSSIKVFESIFFCAPPAPSPSAGAASPAADIVAAARA